MNPKDRPAALLGAVEQHRRAASESYDEVVHEVSARASQVGSLGKADIGALVVWKRLNANTRWASELMSTPDADVRTATADARQYALGASDIEAAAAGARRSLSSIPGFGVGDALASAVIYALAPDRMAVYDSRAQTGIERLGMTLTSSRGRYGRYMVLVQQLMADTAKHGSELTAREVDLALYTLGGPRA